MRVLFVTMMAALALVMVALTADAKPKRATELTPAQWAAAKAGLLTNLEIEFRTGDAIPIEFAAEGDLLESRAPIAGELVVKRDFWLKLVADRVLVSLDGVNYRNHNDVLTGSLEIGAAPDANGGLSNAVKVLLKAHLK